jgi:hypothetical protein
MKPIRSALIMLLMFWTTACGSFTTVYSSKRDVPISSILQGMRKGDHLRIKLKDSTDLTAAFRAMDDESLRVASWTSSQQIMEERTIYLSDIAALSKWQSHSGETVALIGVSTLLIAIIVFASTVRISGSSGLRL